MRLPWTPDLPAHWAIARGSQVAARVRRPPRDTDGVVTAFRDGEVTLRVNRRTDGFTEALQEIGYHGVRKGDLVIHSMDGFAGAIGVSDSDGKVSPVVHAYETPDADARFLAYSLRVAAWSGYIQSLARGIRERSTAFDPVTFKYMLLPQPPMAEQRAIADFVDGETAKIDALIAKQNELIALLRERRGSVVEQALNQKDGNTSVLKLAWSFTFHNGDRGASYPSREDFVSDGVPFINAGHLHNGQIDFDSMNFVTDEQFRAMGGAKLVAGDYLFCLRGSLGKFGVFSGRRYKTGALASSLVALRCIDPLLDSDYFGYVLQSRRMQDLISLAQTGSAQPNLSVEQLAQFRFDVPDIAQQRQLTARLGDETTKIDALIAKAEEHIALAQERRAALITAAVTGQIDITGKVA